VVYNVEFVAKKILEIFKFDVELAQREVTFRLIKEKISRLDTDRIPDYVIILALGYLMGQKKVKMRVYRRDQAQIGLVYFSLIK